MSEFEKELDELMKLGSSPNLTKYQAYHKKRQELCEKYEPKNLVEVEQFVADWFDKNKDNLEYRIWEYIKYWYSQEKDDFYNFMDNAGNCKPIETLIRMKIEGYTVKKEQLYEVLFFEEDSDKYLLMKIGETTFHDFESENEGYFQQHFTESEIKAIDERYWAFAVKVDEGEE